MEKAKIILLHSVPVDNNYIIGIPDIDAEDERQAAFEAIAETGYDVEFTAGALTEVNIKKALTTRDIVLVGAHGVKESESIIIEDEWGIAKILSVEEFTNLVTQAKEEGITAKLVFLGVCHSEQCGIVLQDYGVEHVIAITHEERIRNIVSKTFFKTLLKQVLHGKQIKIAVEDALDAVCSLKEIEEDRRLIQRQKFVLLSRNSSSLLFHEPQPCVVAASQACDGRSQRCEVIGLPEPLRKYKYIGRPELYKTVLENLICNESIRVVVLNQKERGLGSTVFLKKICWYVSDRCKFAAVYFYQRYRDAHQLLLTNKPPSNSLIVIDPCYDDLTMEEGQKLITCFWDKISQLNLENLLEIKLLVVNKQYVTTNKNDMFDWVRTRTSLAINLDFASLTFENTRFLYNTHWVPGTPFEEDLVKKAEGNMAAIVWNSKLAFIQSERLAQEFLVEGRDDLRPLIEQVSRDCIYGFGQSDIYSRNLVEMELDFIFQVAKKFKTMGEFWQIWLSKTLTTLSMLERYYTKRYILGFLGKDKAQQCLKGKPNGYYLLRVSESSPGSLVISARTDQDGVVIHVPISVSAENQFKVKTADDGDITFTNLESTMKHLKKLFVLVISYEGNDKIEKSEAFSGCI